MVIIANKLLELAIATASCTSCGLADSRSQVVFGIGSPKAQVMIVGEAPGFNEDQAGEPFVGAAGHLLDRLLEEIEIDRSAVYLTNVIKCRAPNDRVPQAEEVDACKGYLLEQMKLIEPKVVVVLGALVSQLFLKSTLPISQLRGQSYDWWRGIVVIPTHSLAEGLAGGPDVVDAMQADFVALRAVVDRPISSI